MCALVYSLYLNGTIALAFGWSLTESTIPEQVHFTFGRKLTIYFAFYISSCYWFREIFPLTFVLSAPAFPFFPFQITLYRNVHGNNQLFVECILDIFFVVQLFLFRNENSRLMSQFLPVL